MLAAYKEEILTVSWVKAVARVWRRMPGTGAGDGGRLSSGVLAGGVGMLMMAAVKSCSPQLSFRSEARALRLERLRREHTDSCSSETSAAAASHVLLFTFAALRSWS